MEPSVEFRLRGSPLDPASLVGSVRHPGCGGYASFEGWVRDDQAGRAVDHLVYEAYPALALREGRRILSEAADRFGVRRAAAVHRTGRLEIGEVAVWIGVSSPHRREALEACSWIIDEIKRSLPVWKKEFFRDGTAEWTRCIRCAEAGPHVH